PQPMTQADRRNAAPDEYGPRNPRERLSILPPPLQDEYAPSYASSQQQQQQQRSIANDVPQLPPVAIRNRNPVERPRNSAPPPIDFASRPAPNQRLSLTYNEQDEYSYQRGPKALPPPEDYTRRTNQHQQQQQQQMYQQQPPPPP